MAEKTELGRLLARARARLTSAGIADAALEARLIVEHLTETVRIDSVSNPSQMIDAAKTQAVEAAVERRLAGEPVHRILGYREFFGLPLRLSPDTLEPRPDTETLVHLVLPFVHAVAARDGACRILDLGAGTGAIALALLDREPKAVATGTDISAGALATASANADMLGVGSRYSTLESDWFERVTGRFHLIVANPPYIRSNELLHLQPEVRHFDPMRALDGGADGLDAYRAIASDAAKHLEPESRIAVEIGYDQRASVSRIFSEAGFALVSGASDLGGRDRALMWEL